MLEALQALLLKRMDRVVKATDTLAEGAIWIDETAGISHTELRSKIQRWQRTQGIDLVMVDYLQLMHAVQSDGKRFSVREQEIAEIIYITNCQLSLWGGVSSSCELL